MHLSSVSTKCCETCLTGPTGYVNARSRPGTPGTLPTLSSRRFHIPFLYASRHPREPRSVLPFHIQYNFFVLLTVFLLLCLFLTSRHLKFKSPIGKRFDVASAHAPLGRPRAPGRSPSSRTSAVRRRSTDERRRSD